MSVRDLVLIAVFAAVTAALGLLPPIPVPLIPAPITAQTLGVMLAGAILGARRGGLSLLVFCALVLAGLPLLSGGRGGLGILAGPTGGFFVGFVFGAFATGWLVERLWSRINWLGFFAATTFGGIGVVYLIGIPWLSVAADLSLTQAAAGSAVFIPGDLVKAVVAAIIADVVRRGYPVIGRAG